LVSRRRRQRREIRVDQPIDRREPQTRDDEQCDHDGGKSRNAPSAWPGGI
jgi:hypothetical protein